MISNAPTLSIVILTKDEEKNIADCIARVRFADEIVVVDDKSQDNTREIAKRLGAKVFVRDMDKDYSAQSNFGMENATGKWVFFLDADERVPEGLAKEIRTKISNETRYKGYFVKRDDFMWGRWLKNGEVGSTRVLRLVRKGSGRWRRRVHPIFEITGKTRVLDNHLEHYPHPTLRDFIKSVNRWSTWHAIANREERKKSSLLKILVWPLAHFVKNFILRRGFMDGVPGFVFAMMMALHSFLAWSKLWMLQKGYTKI